MDITEIFYCETYKDADQMIRPHLSPRGKNIVGPFRTYNAAIQHGTDTPCSHFTVSKAYAKTSAEHIPFVEDRSPESGRES